MTRSASGQPARSSADSSVNVILFVEAPFKITNHDSSPRQDDAPGTLILNEIEFNSNTLICKADCVGLMANAPGISGRVTAKKKAAIAALFPDSISLASRI